MIPYHHAIGDENAAWPVVIFAGNRLLGLGFWIAPGRILTCAHVVHSAHKDLAVTPLFQKQKLSFVELLEVDPELDLALLASYRSWSLPPAELPALRYAERLGFAKDQQRWKAWGIPQSAIGDLPGGLSPELTLQRIRAAVRLGEGRVADKVGPHRYQVKAEGATLFETGFSGAGVRTADPGLRSEAGAVVGILTARDGFAEDPASEVGFFVSMDGVIGRFPELRKQVGWRFDIDENLRTSWRCEVDDLARARLGSYFTGRRAAFAKIDSILQSSGPRILGPALVLGSAGAGKSALLREFVQQNGLAVDFAIHLRDLTPDEFVTRLAEAFSLRNPLKAGGSAVAREQLVRQVGELSGRLRKRPLVVADSLDEAREHSRPIATLLGILGRSANVLVAMRSGHEQRLAGALRPADTIDLDSSDYFLSSDLREFIERLFRTEYPSHPTDLAASVEPITSASGRNFLIAGLLALARIEAYRSQEPWDDRLLPSNVAAAMNVFIERLPDPVRAWELLIPPALGLGEGWPVRLWPAAVSGLTGSECDPQEIVAFRHSAVEYLIEQAFSPTERSVRLYHDALRMTVAGKRLERAKAWSSDAEKAHQMDQQVLVTVLLEYIRDRGWKEAIPYILTYLPQHAAESGHLKKLIKDIDFLCHVDPRRLQLAVSEDDSLRSTPSIMAHAFALHLLGNDAERNGSVLLMASLYLGFEQLTTRLLQSELRCTPSATWFGQIRESPLPMSSGHRDWVTAVTVLQSEGPCLVATASADRTVMLWSPDADADLPIATLTGHSDCVRDVAPISLDGGVGLVTASDDGSVKLWNPTAQGYEESCSLAGHTDWVRAAKAYRSKEGIRIVSAGDDGTVRLWNPELDRPETRVFRGHTGWVLTLCVFFAGESPRILSGGADGRILVWDPESAEDEPLFSFDHHTDAVRAITAYERPDGWRIASVGDDRIVFIWPFEHPERYHQIDNYTRSIRAIKAFRDKSNRILITGSADHLIRIHELDDEERVVRTEILRGHNDWVRGVEMIQSESDEGMTLLSGGDDGTARLWSYSQNGSRLRRSYEENRSWLRTVCSVGTKTRPQIAAAGADGQIHFWDLGGSGDPFRSLSGHSSWVRALLFLQETKHSKSKLVSAGDDGSIRLWRPFGDEPHRSELLYSGTHPLRALTHFSMAGKIWLAAVSDEGIIRLWDLERPQKTLRRLTGSTDWLRCLCVFTYEGRCLVAAGGDDRILRVWDLAQATDKPISESPGHSNSIRALCAIDTDPTQKEGVCLITTSDDGTVRSWIWHAATAHLQEQVVVQGHKGSGLALCPRKTGTLQRVVSVSADQYIKEWDPWTLELHAEMPTLSPNFSATLVSPDHLVLINQRGILQVDLTPLSAPARDTVH